MSTPVVTVCFMLEVHNAISSIYLILSNLHLLPKQATVLSKTVFILKGILFSEN